MIPAVEKLEKVAIHGKIIEEYPERERVLIYSEIEEDGLPVHIVVDYSEPEEPVIVTSYVPDSKYWIKYQIRKKQCEIMTVLRKRKCPECGAEMHLRLINPLYQRDECETQIDVIGIPANVCTKCFYRIIPGKIAKYIDSIIDPIVESESAQQEKILPSPHIGIQFPQLKENYTADFQMPAQRRLFQRQG
ncbi:MAG: hypothetical protein B6245_22880 [Desulfobacteraceae bacterium 4572_88]|nr:MAG: hypothetical protein B6245_22880 [Desulfobacteraceae bacterium 4572_88]